MKPDMELDLWRTDWQSFSESPVVDDLRARVARQSRYLRWMLLGDILVTVVIGGGSIVLAALYPEPAYILLAAATWLFIAIAWIFGITNRRNAWSPAAGTTSAFLDLSIRRCRASLRTVIFGAVLYVCEMAFCLTWIFSQTGTISFTTVLVVAICTIVFFAYLIWYKTRKRRDLTYLHTIKHEMERSE